MDSAWVSGTQNLGSILAELLLFLPWFSQCQGFFDPVSHLGGVLLE